MTRRATIKRAKVRRGRSLPATGGYLLPDFMFDLGPRDRVFPRSMVEEMRALLTGRDPSSPASVKTLRALAEQIADLGSSAIAADILGLPPNDVLFGQITGAVPVLLHRGEFHHPDFPGVIFSGPDDMPDEIRRAIGEAKGSP